MKAFGVAATVLFATFSSANSLTTRYDSDNYGSAGGAVYFDVTVGPIDIIVNAYDTNTTSPGGRSFTFDVYTCLGSYYQNIYSPDWVLVASGTGVGNAVDIPSPVTLDAPFQLQADTLYTMALVISSGHRYTMEPSGHYANDDLALDLGAATNVPFQGKVFWPRVWNGTIYYDVVPEPATLSVLLVGAALLYLRKRRLS